MSQQINLGQVHLQIFQPKSELKKMDILFYDSVCRLNRNLNLSIIYQLIKTLTLVIFIPINYTIVSGVHEEGIKAAMILLLVGSVLQLFTVLLYRCVAMRDSGLIVSLASQMGHATQEPITGSLSKIQDCVSATMFNQQNLTLLSSQGLTQDLKQMYTTVLSSNIRQMIIRLHPCIHNIQNLAEFVGFSSFVYGIVALSIYQTNTPQLVIIIIVLVLEGLSKAFIILAILVIALIPLLCCLFCCVCCFCSGAGEETKLPDEEKATEKMITEADGTCSICYQNFIVGDNVVRLRCSPKHMFHPLCISGWVKLKATCPNCRAGINEGTQVVEQ